MNRDEAEIEATGFGFDKGSEGNAGKGFFAGAGNGFAGNVFELAEVG